jgi:hypothetical protein
LKEKLVEPVEKLKAAGKAVGEAKSHEVEEEKGRVEFQIATINSLSKLETSFVHHRLEAMNQFKDRLEALRDAPPSINLDYEVKNILGPKPPDAGLEQAMQLAQDQFELRLYEQYYVKSGRAYRQNEMYSGEILTWSLEGVPHKVKEKVRELKGDWIWQGLRVVEHQRKDYIGHNI